MDLILTRKQFRSDGIFGEYTKTNGTFLFVSLEHAYPIEGAFSPKLSTGVYTCKRGTHSLHDDKPFETFEIMGVPDFEEKKVNGLLIHVGNYQEDSEGCSLIAKQIGGKSDGGKMVMQSKEAFKEFMAMQDGVDEFQLTVE